MILMTMIKAQVQAPQVITSLVIKKKRNMAS